MSALSIPQPLFPKPRVPADLPPAPYRLIILSLTISATTFSRKL
jgi:hypothetical protein